MDKLSSWLFWINVGNSFAFTLRKRFILNPRPSKRALGGTVERWNGGTVERWNSGTVERWNGGTVENQPKSSNNCKLGECVRWESGGGAVGSGSRRGVQNVMSL